LATTIDVPRLPGLRRDEGGLLMSDVPWGMVRLGTGETVTRQEAKEMAAAWGVERMRRPPVKFAGHPNTDQRIAALATLKGGSDV
jgi:hypothetical protein